MSKNSPIPRDDAPMAAKPQLPVIIGSFVSGVAAMTLVGVMAPAIAAAGSPQPAIEQAGDSEFSGAPIGLTEITETQRANIAARLEAAEHTLSEARAMTDAAVARLSR